MTARPTPARTVLAAALAVALGAVAPGCSTGATEPSTNSDVGAVVGVIATGCAPTPGLGTGAVIGRPGRVVTVAHTVAGADGITVVDVTGSVHDATLVALDPRADLAVLDVAGLDAPVLDVVDGDPDVGPATALRWSDDRAMRNPVDITQRLRITIDDIYGDESGVRTGIELAGDIVVGDSGGPVVDRDGRVVGVVYARSQQRPSTGFATDAAEIRSILASAADAPTEASAAIAAGRCA